jgi:predicted GNAT family acetyltransferase
MSPEVSVADDPASGRYVIEAGGTRAGFLTYKLSDGRIALNHAEIDPASEGTGLGSQLVTYALQDARARGLEVLPHCPFVRHYIEHHDEFQNLVPEAVRGRFGLQ